MISESFDVISWNIGSLKAKRNPKKVGAMSIESWFSHVCPKVVAFQETYWKDSLKELDLDDEYVPVHEINRSNGAYSLAVYLHRSVALVDNGRIGNRYFFCQWVKVKAPQIDDLYIVNVYLPHTDSIGGLGKIKSWYCKLKKQIDLWKRNGSKVLIVGDFNTHNPRFGEYPPTNSRRLRVVLENDFIDRCISHLLHYLSQHVDEVVIHHPILTT